MRQNQAFDALLFFHRHILRRKLLTPVCRLLQSSTVALPCLFRSTIRPLPGPRHKLSTTWTLLAFHVKSLQAGELSRRCSGGKGGHHGE